LRRWPPKRVRLSCESSGGSPKLRRPFSGTSASSKDSGTRPTATRQICAVTSPLPIGSVIVGGRPSGAGRHQRQCLIQSLLEQIAGQAAEPTRVDRQRLMHRTPPAGSEPGSRRTIPGDDRRSRETPPRELDRARPGAPAPVRAAAAPGQGCGCASSLPVARREARPGRRRSRRAPPAPRRRCMRSRRGRRSRPSGSGWCERRSCRRRARKPPP